MILRLHVCLMAPRGRFKVGCQQQSEFAQPPIILGGPFLLPTSVSPVVGFSSYPVRLCSQTFNYINSCLDGWWRRRNNLTN
jgi:hypothetical protein